jgi:ATP-dependent NAD(P)H-hydrate dehydratase
MICEEKGGLKRSGGIGDILSGSIGTFVAWNRILQDKGVENDILLSCWMAACLTKRATRVAFEKRRRSMTAPDILDEIGTVVDEIASSTIIEDS